MLALVVYSTIHKPSLTKISSLHYNINFPQISISLYSEFYCTYIIRCGNSTFNKLYLLCINQNFVNHMHVCKIHLCVCMYIFLLVHTNKSLIFTFWWTQKNNINEPFVFSKMKIIVELSWAVMEGVNAIFSVFCNFLFDWTIFRIILWCTFFNYLS